MAPSTAQENGLGLAAEDIPRLSPPRSAPVGAFDTLRSADLDEVRNALDRLFYPARVETLGRGARLEGSWVSGVRLSHMTLGFIRFGAETLVDPGPIGAYHVNVPIAGRVESMCGSRRAVAMPRHGVTFSPEPHSTLPRFGVDATLLCIKIRRSSLESELASHVGRPVRGQVDFEFSYDLTTPAAMGWLATLRLLIEELRRPTGLVDASAQHCEHLERLVISGLLLAQRHELSSELDTYQRPARPRTVARVIDLIEEDPARSYTVGDLARHAGVSARRLQQGFHDQLGMSPMEFLRTTRLERAHRDLRRGEDPVTDVALRWGFHHLGRFAQAYRKQYGVLPSEVRCGTGGRPF